MYIVPSTLTDEEVAGLEASVKAGLEKYGAVLVDSTRLGKFKLAYPIKNMRHGHYNLAHFTAETTSLAKIDEYLRIMANMMRHLILRADEAGVSKFDLVQFTEVNVETKEERPRRRVNKDGKPEDAKSATDSDEVKKEDSKEDKEDAEVVEEDIDKKIDEALKGNAA